jgi:hypothetical protein
MIQYRDFSKTKQIKVLLGVLGGGLLAGLLFALSILYYYNPSGSYLAKNMLLDPHQAYTLRFIEPGSKGKSEGKYAFEGIYFSYFDPSLKQQKTLKISQDQYAIFYQRVANESSVENPNEEIQRTFNHTHPVTLSLKVRSVGEDLGKGAELTFYQVDFAEGSDYYRIQVRQSGAGTSWAYFYHPGIYQETMTLFHPNFHSTL